jgi:rhomboid protease GluP
MAGCIILYLVSLVLDPGNVVWVQGWSILQPSQLGIISLGASGSVPVFELGWWWTIFSASWLHANLLHIGFNMLWVRQLAPATERLFGPGRMMIIYLVSGATGFAMSVIAGSPLTLGASAAIFGLLGALVRYGRRTGSNAIGRQAWTWAAMLFIFGLAMRGVDNFAHFGGFVGGYLMAVWLDPLKPEKTDHFVAALVGILISAMAVGASLISAFLSGR